MLIKHPHSYLLIILITISTHSIVYCQKNLFIPRDIIEAYDNGTRSIDGNPGKNYWQNFAEYKIDVKVIPETKILYGSEEILYYNNSPDSLNLLIVRLYQNFYKKGSARDFTISENSANDGVDLTKMIIADDTIDVDDPKMLLFNSTNIAINLKNPLPPKSSIKIFFDWNFEIPSISKLRMGAYDSTSFFISLWFPQIAVYDDIDGWDTHNYGGTQEFYNDFKNFEVQITVPNNFGVWATGELQNPEEILDNKTLKKYIEAKTSDEVVNIITSEDIDDGGVFKKNKSENVWKFTAHYVPDFAFAISDHYLWDGASTVVDSSKMQRVFISAAYKRESTDFYEVANFAKQSIEYYSYELPGIPFPYPTLTVFNGSGGMEYPMMINDGSASTLDGAFRLTSHEVAHTYFPFYMGTNEKKYAFMDEGFAVMLPFDFQERLSDNPRRKREANSYQNFAGNEIDLPPMIPSIFLHGQTYRVASYSRASLAYYFLEDLLGKDEFKQSLQEFMRRWNGKHPLPYDMFFTFNEVTGMNLNWYWNEWFFERGFPDLALKKVIMEDGNVKVEIWKIGNVPIPIELEIIYEDETNEKIYYTTEVWKSGNEIFEVIHKTEKAVSEVKLGSDFIPDSNKENNLILVH